MTYIFEEIRKERERQDKLHPIHPVDPSYALPILVEEVGEVAKAILENKKEEYRKELIEVAAVAVRMIQKYDEVLLKSVYSDLGKKEKKKDKKGKK